MSETIGIIGCGWLGYPLALSLVQEGHTVHGSTTSPNKLEQLQNSGILPCHLALSEDKIEGDIHAFLKDVTILIINVPPKLRGGNNENYVAKMQLLCAAVKSSSVKKVLFVSSTSVYGDSEGIVTEQTPTNPTTESGKQLVASEQLFWTDAELHTTIVRFGGLIGPERHPVNHLAGRKALPNGNAAINLIHLDDCIRILKTIITHNYWGEVFNGVYPHHPSKKEYYSIEARQRGLEPPEYLKNNVAKRGEIEPHNLTTVKNFRFHTTIVSLYTTA